MKKLMILLSFVAAGFGCAKKDNNNNNNNNNAFAATTFMCVQASTGAPVATQLCSTSANAAYICVQSATGQQVTNNNCQSTGTFICTMRITGAQVATQLCSTVNVATYKCSDVAGNETDPTYCQQNGGLNGGLNGGTIGQQCYGYYTYPADGRMYACGIATDCKGHVMISQSGQQVQCY